MRLPGDVDPPVVGQDHVGLFAHQELGPGRQEAAAAQVVQLFDQDGRVHDHAVADDAKLAGMEDARRDQVEDRLFALDHQSMAGVVAPVKPDDNVGLFGVQIHDLALPLIPPLGSYHDYICHNDPTPDLIDCKTF